MHHRLSPGHAIAAVRAHRTRHGWRKAPPPPPDFRPHNTLYSSRLCAGPVGYGDIADTGLDPSFDPLAKRSDALIDGLIGGHGKGPNDYPQMWGKGPDQDQSAPTAAPTPLPQGQLNFQVKGKIADIKPIAAGLYQAYTGCDEVYVTVHIRVEDWGEDMYWDIDGGRRFGSSSQNRTLSFFRVSAFASLALLTP